MKNLIASLFHILFFFKRVNAKNQCGHQDIAGTFLVHDIGRTCGWAKNNPIRCDIDQIRINCPVTCNVPCLPTDTKPIAHAIRKKSPDIADKIEEEQSDTLRECEDENDLVATLFVVDGVERSCLWARLMKRCDIDPIIRRSCPLTCNVPCILPAVVETRLDKENIPEEEIIRTSFRVHAGSTNENGGISLRKVSIIAPLGFATMIIVASLRSIHSL